MPDIKLSVSTEELGVDTGTLEKWLKRIGDWVTKNEELLVCSGNGNTITLRSPAQGVLKKIFVQEDMPFKAGEVLGILRTVMGGT